MVDTDHLIRKVLIICIIIELSLFIADAIFTYAGVIDIRSIKRFFNMAREDGLGSLLAVIQTLLLSLTLWLIVLTHKAKDIRPVIRYGWVFLAVFFTYLTLDDGAEIHERLGTVYRIMSEQSPADGLLHLFPSYPWQVLFLPVFAVIGLYMLWFLWTNFENQADFRLVFGGLIMYAIAVSLDFIEGLDKNHALNVHEWLRSKFDLRPYTVRHFGKTMEETIEMFGTTLIWLAFLRHFMRQNTCFQINFVQSSLMKK